MKRILVPTDFSKQADNALKIAAQIARKYNGEIFLLHFLDITLRGTDPLSARAGTGLPEALFFMKFAHKKFTETFDKFSHYLEGVTVHETVEFDEAFDGIMSVSKKYDCDIIIMGSNGSEGLKEIFIGSNTERVVRFSDIPVLIIKEEVTNFEIRSFVFVSNLRLSNRNAFEAALSFATLFEVELQLAYINTPHKFKTTAELDVMFNDFIKNVNFKLSQFHIYNDVTVEQGIRNIAFKMDADLIGIGTHRRKGISYFIRGSLAKDVVNHIKKPILTFKM